ncbi:hypothetical protein SISNIDRAFT_549192 [Sistotremastrum niveocremeum HHB9708]|uniref:ZZ-type domain-containing protein n=1 Tax=Sistotremastrum niveocremeum HHB9708 TaxID=1314777 RepID=A0A164W182_9AGAM|nr:hypothetical protein SISNIDRAFT_549192 [Sistotremastrum niveocremeum HHB9708]
MGDGLDECAGADEDIVHVLVYKSERGRGGEQKAVTKYESDRTSDVSARVSGCFGDCRWRLSVRSASARVGTNVSLAMEYASISSVRPDRPLIVKCTFDRSQKKVQFASARNCTLPLLRTKIEQCFSLAAIAFSLSYKDDDGEVMEITSDGDLTEAIHYFQGGVDDVPISSAASILSGRSFGSRKISLRLLVQVEYDGPSLSDTSSLVSIEEYRNRNHSDEGLDFDDNSVNSFQSSEPPEDDAVTVSSKDFGGHPVVPTSGYNQPSTSFAKPSTSKTVLGRRVQITESSRHRPDPPHSISLSESEPDIQLGNGHDSPASSSVYSAEARYPEDPSAVFERLRYLEQQGKPTSPFHMDVSLGQTERGWEWIRRQDVETHPTSLDYHDDSSIEDAVPANLDDAASIRGALALEQNSSGRYYYSYTASSSGAPINSVHDERSEDLSLLESDHGSYHAPHDHRPNEPSTSRPFQRAQSDPVPSSSRSIPNSYNSDPLTRLHGIHPDIPPEVLRFVNLSDSSAPPHEVLTHCSSCNNSLDFLRYVCSTCGETKPHTHMNGNGKLKAPATDVHAYPPTTQHHSAMSSQAGDSLWAPPHNKPLPRIPGTPAPTTTSLQSPIECGYELCPDCIQTVGVVHAVEATSASSFSSTASVDSGSSQSWRRTAPRKKGAMRHAYREQHWTGAGWEDVEQDDATQCSTCSSALVSIRYRCASCDKITLCRSCYAQVHEIHPSHAFLEIADKTPRETPTRRSQSVPEVHTFHEDSDEPSMLHPGVKCAHCMLDIIGARFHCAICDSVDICANCESAGLPGNLTSPDGGHDSSHIMIKIPIPLESTEVKTASREAKYLWKDRDEPSVQSNNRSSGPRSDSGSSLYARTVVGNRRNADATDALNHNIPCDSCRRNIVGVRYQCATCPSLDKSYNLCSTCEPRSYLIHNPMHSFFKVVRPVDKQIESPLGFLPSVYYVPAGTKEDGTQNADNPTEYLQELYHPNALCDRCMDPIRGLWHRCVYCAKDLCEDCEALDTHNATHFSIVFKSLVDMAQYRNFTDLEDSANSPPLVPYPVYND